MSDTDEKTLPSTRAPEAPRTVSGEHLTEQFQGPLVLPDGLDPNERVVQAILLSDARAVERFNWEQERWYEHKRAEDARRPVYEAERRAQAEHAAKLGELIADLQLVTSQLSAEIKRVSAQQIEMSQRLGQIEADMLSALSAIRQVGKEIGVVMGRIDNTDTDVAGLRDELRRVKATVDDIARRLDHLEERMPTSAPPTDPGAG